MAVSKTLLWLKVLFSPEEWNHRDTKRAEFNSSASKHRGRIEKRPKRENLTCKNNNIWGTNLRRRIPDSISLLTYTAFSSVKLNVRPPVTSVFAHDDANDFYPQSTTRHDLITLRIGPITWTKNPVFFRAKRDTTREEREIDRISQSKVRKPKNAIILFCDDS